MTETEIMKGLECCGRDSCNGCPYRGKCHQGNPMIQDALNLLNSKNAKIDRLTEIEDAHREQNGELRKEVEFMRQYIHDQGLEFDLLSKYNKSNKKIRTTNWLTKDMSAEKIAEKKAKAIGECNAEIRAEAIKEFVEKIYRSCAMYGQKDKFNKTVFLNIVARIAKEMGVE